MAQIDVVTAEVLRNAVVVAAEEMSSTLVRTAHNPLLYDVQDFGLGILSPEGECWADAPGMTAFVGVLSHTISSGIAEHGIENMRDGDIFIANDPYTTGNHISDVSIYMPIFHADRLVAFAAVTAHWADIGGKTPGGWCPDSVDVYQEGICFSHEKLVDRGEQNKALLSIIRNNTRCPDVVLGDLNAQIAACRQGATRLISLCDKYGSDQLRAAMNLAIDRADKDARRQISALQDGVYTVSQMMDEDGVVKGAPFTVQLTLTISGDSITASFAGTSEVRAGPVNCPEYAARSLVRAAIKGILSPTEPANEGDFKALTFDIAPDLVVSPQRPAPVDSYGYMCIAVWELTMRALAMVAPERAVAGGGQLCMPTLSRVDPRLGTPFVLADPLDVGNGARPASDAPTMAIPTMGDVPNMPVEVVEMRYPVRIDRFGLRPESIGHGQFLGGAGVRRDYRLLEPGIMVYTAFENVRDPLGRGREGGLDGAPPVVIVNPDTDEEQVMEERAGIGPFKPGEVISMRSGGGGGWGMPSARDAAHVQADVRNGLLTAADAKAIYNIDTAA